jgi:hypothetical protein
MVVSLFETGYLATGAGLFEAAPGHLSAGRHVAVRLSDAMRRGALCHHTTIDSDSVDFLRLDWFTVAPLPVDEARRLFSLQPKSMDAISAGSVGPRQPGGISSYQHNAGRHLARTLGRHYDALGASPT